MTGLSDPPRAHAPTPERVRLAQVVRNAALGVPGVLETDPGPAGRFLTAGGGERILGVTSVAAAGGGYDVALRLRCELVPLHELGATVTVAVRQAAAAIGVVISDLRVQITDVVARERT